MNKYILIQGTDDGLNTEFFESEQDLINYLDDEDNMIENINFLPSMPRNFEAELYTDDAIILKYEIVVPKPKMVVKTYEL